MGAPRQCAEVLLQNPNLKRSNAEAFLRIAHKTTCRCGGRNCYSARIKDILNQDGGWLATLAKGLATVAGMDQTPNTEVYACLDCGGTYSR